ncbi:hypothetical protein [Streptomyces sp. RKAG290]|uniref:hypothetical protein n=1 Tax=Streptomyces sp. RKAG290 TaxID=2888348 RepID=UPI0035A8E4CE
MAVRSVAAATIPAARPQVTAAGTPSPSPADSCSSPALRPDPPVPTRSNWPASRPRTVAQTAPTAIAGKVTRVSSPDSHRSDHHTTTSSSTSEARYSSQSPSCTPDGPVQAPSSSH